MTAPRRKRWLAILLTASLVLNVFLGAFFLGRIVFDHDHRRDNDGRRFTMRLELKAITKALPDDARGALYDHLRERAESMRPVFGDIRATRREIMELLAADTLDRDALAERLDHLRTELAKVHAALQEIVFNAAQDMTPEQRKRMARVLRRMHEHEHEDDDQRRNNAPDDDRR